MIEIRIIRSDVMSIVEGISVLVRQHNEGSPTFEQLWASVSEQKKLDIYYREALGDLEQRLREWLPETTAQYSLTTDGTDYFISITPGKWWPTRLEGLVKNKIQDYVVHAIAAGWFGSFSGLTVQDYAGIAAQDLTDIHVLLEMREFSFTESTRTANTAKPEDTQGASSTQRGSDTIKPENDESASAEERGSDNTSKSEGGEIEDAGERGSDTIKPENDESASAEERASDTSKSEGGETEDAGERGSDTDKPENDESASADERASDTDKSEGGETEDAGERGSDTDKPENDESASAEERGADTEKAEGGETEDAGERGADTEKPTNDESASAGQRKGDNRRVDDEEGAATSGLRYEDEYKEFVDQREQRARTRRDDRERKDIASGSALGMTTSRNRDNGPVCITHDWTDWSGTHICENMPDQYRMMHMDGRIVRHSVIYPRGITDNRQRTTDNGQKRYWPRQDKPWYGSLAEAGHQQQEQMNREHERATRRLGPGPYMEKYRDLHDEEFMQDHECGHDDCGHHGLKPLEW